MKARYIRYFGMALITLTLILATAGIIFAILDTSFKPHWGLLYRFLALAENGLWFSLAVLCIGIPLGRYYRKHGNLPDPLPQRVTRAFKYHLFSLCVIALGAVALLLFCRIPDACLFFVGPLIFLVLTLLIFSTASFLTGLVFIIFGKK